MQVSIKRKPCERILIVKRCFKEVTLPCQPFGSHFTRVIPTVHLESVTSESPTCNQALFRALYTPSEQDLDISSLQVPAGLSPKISEDKLMHLNNMSLFPFELFEFQCINLIFDCLFVCFFNLVNVSAVDDVFALKLGFLVSVSTQPVHQICSYECL